MTRIGNLSLNLVGGKLCWNYQYWFNWILSFALSGLQNHFAMLDIWHNTLKHIQECLTLLVDILKVYQTNRHIFSMKWSMKISHYFFLSLKSLPPFKKVAFICFDGRPLKVMKNAFYFTLNLLFFLKIFEVGLSHSVLPPFLTGGGGGLKNFQCWPKGGDFRSLSF